MSAAIEAGSGAAGTLGALGTRLGVGPLASGTVRVGSLLGGETGAVEVPSAEERDAAGAGAELPTVPSVGAARRR